MKITLTQLSILVWMTSVAYATPLSAQELLGRRVNLEVNKQPIYAVLAQLEKAADVQFVYSARVVDSKQKISLNMHNEKLSVVLETVFDRANISWEIVGGQIILKKRRVLSVDAGKDSVPETSVDVEKSIKGSVKDAVNKEVLPGVNILVKGSNQGTTTDENGNFSLSVPDDARVTLTFSFVGYLSQEITANPGSPVSAFLAADTKSLEEVVVTALGRQRKTKALGYAVGEIKNEDLTKVPQDNVVNALTGKVPGVRVINTSPDLNSDPMVMIRGFTSLSGNNAPLIVVDGLPTGTDVSVMSDLSADNIESVNVLKGASAAALYGSRAGNGVLLITTKNGNTGKKGLGVSVNAAYSASIPYGYVPIQQRFVNGSNGNFDQTSNLWWGPEMGTSVARFGTSGLATPLEPHPDNVKDFVDIGSSFVNDVTISNANDKLSFSLSLSDTRAKGVYPKSNLRKDAISLSATYNFSDRLNVSANFNYLNSGSDNFRGVTYNSYPYEDLYFTPNWLDVNDLKDYWAEEHVQQNVWSNGFNNPWFTVNENINTFKKVRPYGNIKLSWNITDDLNLMARVGGFNESYTTKNRIAKSEKSVPNGGYAHLSREFQEINTDFLLNYKKNLSVFSIDASVGGNLFFQNNSFANITGQNFVLPGLYTASNIDRSSVGYSSAQSNKRINSIYAMGSFGFKDAIFLELTGRNDVSSTLPKDNRSYFYPAASLSVVLSDLFSLPKAISLLKLRGGWAKVGKDTSPYMLAMALSRGTWGDATTYSLPSKTPTSNLLPESTISSEIGADISFLKKRVSLNFTYYEVQNKKQITGISVSSSTGYTAANVNAGIVRNRGMEVSLHFVPVQAKSVNWDFTFNFTKEKSKLTGLPTGVSNHQFWERANFFNQTQLGGTVGDLWGPDVKRVAEGEYKGWPLLSANGMAQQGTGNILLGNVMPDFTLGLQTNLAVKRFTFSASFDWRQGGEYYSESMKRLARDGRTESWYKGEGSSTFTGILNNNSYNGDNAALAAEIKSNPGKYNAMDGLTYVGGRNAELGGFSYGDNIANGSFFPGVIEGANGEYVENFGDTGTKYFRTDLIADPGSGYWSRGVQSWIYDASFIKLREFAVAYKLPETFTKRIASGGVSVSLFVRNLMLWTKAKNHLDPESTIMNNSDQFSSSPNYSLGYDRASFFPSTMSSGVKLNIQF
ncbi:SusC/RagA family TonB-linked outer membrane protein [Dyadobacter sp. CY312]|uniref:SusC/RagA family TonB-linked outer membrane protein n=1 Tax=Dyadobacter sp. CY312 TaxID=2907303 RepID=UPI001F2721CA|nr:SusC/RagA family TonB-linked outer membrane protein [Dyadobacter sp. CY312]MCE7044409.1 SusC/RagA family TonB-linked outer membrane protein [Dyadobacter sp. CY312]